MIAATFAIVLAQTCAGMLPPSGMELEWQRNGRAYARDVQLEATASSRSYRRTLTDGARTTHTLTCTGTGANAMLTQRIGEQRQARIPIALRMGASRVIDGVTIRRIAQPQNGAPDARWFSATGAIARVYGIRAGAGIVEMRMQSTSGGVDVYRAFVRRPAPPPPPPPAAPMQLPEVPVTALEGQVAVLQRQNAERLHRARVLEDSVRLLRDSLVRVSAARAAADSALSSARATVPAAQSPLDERLLSMLAVDVFTARGDYDAALALLGNARAGLARFAAVTGRRHPAARIVEETVADVTRACERARRMLPDGSCAAAPQGPFTLVDMMSLLQGGISPAVLAVHAAGACIAFVPDDASLARVRAVGATAQLEHALRSACRAGSAQ